MRGGGARNRAKSESQCHWAASAQILFKVFHNIA
jgi:hypothetical protein